jgi:hypothetical protein
MNIKNRKIICSSQQATTIVEFCSAESLTNLKSIRGPVICLYKVKNDEEAACIANEVIGTAIGAMSSTAVSSNNLKTVSKFTKKSALKSNIVLIICLDDTPLRTMEICASLLAYTNHKCVHISSIIKKAEKLIAYEGIDQKM